MNELEDKNRENGRLQRQTTVVKASETIALMNNLYKIHLDNGAKKLVSNSGNYFLHFSI